MINRHKIKLKCAAISGSGLWLVFLLFGFGFFVTSVKPVQAQQCQSCAAAVNPVVDAQWVTTIKEINDHVTDEFKAHRSWFIGTLWEDNILPSMMLMTEQLSGAAMQQVQIIGSFLDAKQQMKTQQSLQKLQARAHKDYHPSVGMCEFGTSVKSLAASERKAEFSATVMADRSQSRALGNVNSAAAQGPPADLRHRIAQYKTKFCDLSDNDNGLALLCDTGAAINPERMNKDIDFARTVAAPWTLDIDFTDDELTDNEEEVLALASNLYGHDVFVRPNPSALVGTTQKLSEAQKFYMDARSILAKRSVAENSFNAITGMKSRGTAGSREYMVAVLEELGVSSGEAQTILGGLSSGDGNPVDPSYHAQMEVLTKKIYQNPDFYTNLYDKPVNVERKKVALQAIGLMQKFDLFKSYLRHEASLSVLLELAVVDLQDQVENELRSQKAGGRSSNP